MDTQVNTPPVQVNSSGGDFAVGVALGRFETRLAALEKARADDASSVADQFAKVNARLDMTGE